MDKGIWHDLLDRFHSEIFNSFPFFYFPHFIFFLFPFEFCFIGKSEMKDRCERVGVNEIMIYTGKRDCCDISTERTKSVTIPR